MSELDAASHPAPFRESVRVLCLDVNDRVLLMCWRDPHDGKLVWEPPGGGIEPGESTRAAAERELREETGFDVSLAEAPGTPVDCDVWWNGKRHVGSETYFLARFDDPAPALSDAHLLDYEADILIETRWVNPAETVGLAGLVLPADLPAVLARLEPGRTWN